MLPPKPSAEAVALNRVTFGARDTDIERVRQMGWAAWIAEQLSPPQGDDPDLAAHLAVQRMRIRYNGQPKTDQIPGWPDVNEIRPLSYMNARVSTLWDMASRVEVSVAANELTRIEQELNAVTWIRNTHSRFQLREFMADFWNNHFNVGRQEDIYASAALPAYDQTVIRPRTLGNFRDLLGAVATSTAMLRYLDNADSTAANPNENYARELLELHTLGRPAYLGISAPSGGGTVQVAGTAVTAGFTDQDIITASRAFSGWTLEQGQTNLFGPMPFTGRFTFNPLQHNPYAANFMGTGLAAFDSQAQGERILDIVARHPATADFVCTKIARRMFGDVPPQSVVDRGKAAWLANPAAPDQIARVLSAMLVDGNEIQTSAMTKLRRPYERFIAFFRTTNTTVSAFDLAHTAGAALGDGLYVWPTPEGRPDVDVQWLTTSANLYNWNLVLLFFNNPSAFRTNLAAETPAAASASATQLAEYWVGRMVGYSLRPAGMTALINDIASPIGAMAAYASGGIANIERALQRLVALIATSPEFGTR